MKRAPPLLIPRFFLPIFFIASIGGSLAFAACDAQDVNKQSENLGVFAASEAPARLEDESPVYFIEDDGTVGGRLVSSDIELIFEEIRVQDPSGKDVSRTVRGQQTMEIWQRTSTPQFFTDSSEPFLYFEEGGTNYLDDGSQRHVYRIRRQPNRSQTAKPLTPPGPPRVDAVVFERWADAGEDDMLQLNARLSGIPDFQPPPIPPPGMFSEEDEQRAREQQTAYLMSYYENYSTLAGRFQGEIEAAGGRLVEVMPDIGWVSFQIPQVQVNSMLSHAGIDRLTSPYVETEDTACLSGTGHALNCTFPTPTDWLLGQGRIYTRLDSQKFLNAGIDGSITSARHGGLPRLQAGIVESKVFENESLALRDVNLDTRISSLTNCTTDPCTYPTDFTDDYLYSFGGTQWWYEYNAYHGTAVSSVLAGDFLQGQADGEQFGDPNYDDSNPLDLTHCADWENASTGMAPGTAIQYAYTGGGVTNAYARAYAKMRNYLVDITNCSHVIGTGCNIDSDNVHENELETGYDYGISFIAGSGNENEGGGSTCNLRSPADTPKAIAVSSLNADSTACQGYYQSCVIDNSNSAVGGMNAIINGTSYSGIIAGVDLLAPQQISNVTRAFDYNEGPMDENTVYFYWLQSGGGPNWPVGWNHNCEDAFLSGGSSIATPHVSGLALILKHWQLSKGNTYINYSGRLQALLLAMADRWDPDTGRRSSGVSKKSGFGRIKLRYLDHSSFQPADTKPLTFTFTPSSTSVSQYIWSTKVPAGAAFLKCVMFEPEDMSQKNDISDLYLQVNLRNPNSLGNCSTDSAFWGGVIDSSHDIRHMVALTTGVGGRCAEIQIHKRHVTSANATVHVFCYYSSKNDFVDVVD